MDFTNALDVYNNSFRGASAYALRKGFEELAGANGVVIFSELMDASSLFLTANADTVYYLSAIDLSHGPMVIEQPSDAVGTINDMWFSWIIDIGGPGPDRGLGGKYLIVPPGYDGPLPEGGYFVAHSKTNHILYAARAYLVNDDPKPAVDNIKANLKIYPYAPGAFGTSIAQALTGAVRLGAEPTIPETKFVEGSGLAFNTIPPERRRLLRDDQRERPGRARHQLRRRARRPARRHRHRPRQALRAGRADAGHPRRGRGGRQRRRPLAAVALGRPAPGLGDLRELAVVEHALGGRRPLRDPAAALRGRHVQAAARHRRAHAQFAHGLLLRLHARQPRHDHAHPGRRLAVPDDRLRRDRHAVRRGEDLQGDAAQGHPGARLLVLHPLRQPDPLDAADPAEVPARRQPVLSLARRRGRPPTARPRSGSAPSSPRAWPAATGSRPTRRRAGSPSCASTARCRRSSARSGAPAKSRWSSDAMPEARPLNAR